MRHRSRMLVVLLGVVGSLSACATSEQWAQWRQHSSQFASAEHVAFSMKHQGRDVAVQFDPQDLETAKAEAWWGDPVITQPDAPLEIGEYDPWQPFNDRMFRFNRQFDRKVLKPVATVWDKVVPDAVQRGLHNAFDNLGMPRRFVNNLLQLKADGAIRELGRFVINSTFGVAGLFDIAKTASLDRHEADTGQTLGKYGVGPGPYLILPFLPPSTVRDTLGFAADLALDPLNYLLPFAATAGEKGTSVVNERARNLGALESLEKDVLDPYAATRDAVLQRREHVIHEE